MPSKEDAGLIVAASKLAKAEPELWQGFITELANYTRQRKDHFIGATSRIEHWQGRGAEAISLQQLLQTAPEEARKLGEYSK